MGWFVLAVLTLTNFTVFEQAKFGFADGLNVFIGENGVGKSHVLKVAYSLLNVVAQANRDFPTGTAPKSFFQSTITAKLMGVFKPDELGRLTRRGGLSRKSCHIGSLFNQKTYSNFNITFNNSSKAASITDTSPTLLKVAPFPVFLPTRELLTISPGFVSLYETTHLSFEETWRDTCILLGAPLARGPREARIKKLLEPLEAAMGGKVESDSAGRFYLKLASSGIKTEVHLVAEGLRKLAMVARLIATGSLVDVGALFWDEPETNLNPKIIKVVARTILHLCQNNIQVFIASHSLFLLRELDILLQSAEFKNTSARFFGLERTDDGVMVHQGHSIDDIGPIDALTEELSQADRYLGTDGEE